MSQQDLIFAVSTLIVGGALVVFVVTWWRGRGDGGDDKGDDSSHDGQG